MKKAEVSTQKRVILGLTALMLLGSGTSIWSKSEGILDVVGMKELSVEVYAQGVFKDSIPQWASSDINYLVGKKIMQGYNDNSFRASGTMTKLEFLVATIRSVYTEQEIASILADLKVQKPHEEISDYERMIADLNKGLAELGLPQNAREFWGTPYIAVADKTMISDKVKVSFPVLQNDNKLYMGYGLPITREEACQVMYNACTRVRKESLPEMKGIQNIVNRKADKAITIKFTTAVYNCVSNGLIAGIDADYTIAPFKTLTRAEGACILARITDTNRRLPKPVVPTELQEWVQTTASSGKMLTKTNPVTKEVKTMTAIEWDKFQDSVKPTYNGTKTGEYSKDGWWFWHNDVQTWLQLR